ERLRVRALGELDLEIAVVVVGVTDESSVPQHVPDAVLARTRRAHAAPDERQRNIAAPTARSHVRDLPIEYLLAVCDDAHRVAHALGVLHHMRAEYDGLP